MNKDELIVKVSEVVGLPKSKIKEIIEATEDTIVDALKSGEKVMLAGFGIWSVAKRKAREGINPKTKEKIKIAGKKVPVFKVSKTLKEKIK